MSRRRPPATGVSFFAFQDIITSVVGIFTLIIVIMVLELAQTVELTQGGGNPAMSAELLQSLTFLQDEVLTLEETQAMLLDTAVAVTETNKFNATMRIEQAQRLLEQTRDRTARAQQLTQETARSLVQAKLLTEHLLADSLAAESQRQELELLQESRRKVERYNAILDIDRPLIFRDTTQDGKELVLVQLVDGKIHVSAAGLAPNQEFSGSARQDDFQSWLSLHGRPNQHALLIVKPSGASDFQQVQAILTDSSIAYGYDVSAEDAHFVIHADWNEPQ